jgi:hypothetical protein
MSAEESNASYPTTTIRVKPATSKLADTPEQIQQLLNAQKEILTVQKENYSNKNDPCYPQLMSYLKCVEAHTDGLAEGDDCMNETNVYKACRTQHKDWKKQ